MKFIGVDLAAQPENTSICTLEWRDFPRIVSIQRSATDDLILNESCNNVAAIGIDSPFGWPIHFVNFIHQKRAGCSVQPLSKSEANRLKYRTTDTYVQNHFYSLDKNVRPLSVSTDKLGAVALRCVRLVQCLNEKLDEQHKIFEVYPAASLASWMNIMGSYKSETNSEKARSSRENREFILKVLENYGVEVSNFRERLIASHDDIDALICALTAAVAFKGRTHKPSAEMLALVKIEGWIHFPSGSVKDFSKISFEH